MFVPTWIGLNESGVAHEAQSLQAADHHARQGQGRQREAASRTRSVAAGLWKNDSLSQGACQ